MISRNHITNAYPLKSLHEGLFYSFTFTLSPNAGMNFTCTHCTERHWQFIVWNQTDIEGLRALTWYFLLLSVCWSSRLLCTPTVALSVPKQTAVWCNAWMLSPDLRSWVRPLVRLNLGEGGGSVISLSKLDLNNKTNSICYFICIVQYTSKM